MRDFLSLLLTQQRGCLKIPFLDEPTPILALTFTTPQSDTSPNKWFLYTLLGSDKCSLCNVLTACKKLLRGFSTSFFFHGFNFKDQGDSLKINFLFSSKCLRKVQIEQENYTSLLTFLVRHTHFCYLFLFMIKSQKREKRAIF